MDVGVREVAGVVVVVDVVRVVVVVFGVVI